MTRPWSKLETIRAHVRESIRILRLEASLRPDRHRDVVEIITTFTGIDDQVREWNDEDVSLAAEGVRYRVTR